MIQSRIYNFILMLGVGVVLSLGLRAASVVIATSQATPDIVEAVAPTFLGATILTNQDVDVPIEVQINATGKVSDVRFENLPDNREAPMLEACVRRWRFTSSKNEEIRKVKLIFQFRILPSDTPDEQLTTILRPPNIVEVRQRRFLLTHPEALPVRKSPIRKTKRP